MFKKNRSKQAGSQNVFQLCMHEKVQSLAMGLEPWLKKKPTHFQSPTLLGRARKDNIYIYIIFFCNYGFLSFYGESQEQ